MNLRRWVVTARWTHTPTPAVVSRHLTQRAAERRAVHLQTLSAYRDADIRTTKKGPK